LDGVNKKMYIGTGTYKNANTPFYFKSGSTDIFSLADKLYWDGTTLTVAGNINVTGGNALKTGDAANDVNSGTTTISGTQITTNTINAQQISSLNFTSKTAVFDKGTIGGWVINSDSIASKLDSNGRSRLKLSPTPEIRVNDVDGNGKLFIRSGPLTTPTNSSISVTANFDSVTLPNTTSVDYQAFTDGGYQTFTITSPGAYTGTISADGYSSVAYMSDSSWTGYMYVGLSYQIASNSTFTALIADGVITSKGVGSYTENGYNTQLDLPSTSVGINLALAAGTYYSRLRWTVIYYSESGTITVSAVSSGAKSPSLALTNTLAEFTDEGLQLIYNADTYFRIQRGSLQGSNLDAYVKIGGKLEVTGDIVSLASDRRLKENIIPIDGALAKIDKINGVYFNYTDKAKEANQHFADGRQVGLIAQEIQEVLPEVISFAPFDYGVDNQNISGENYLTLNYDKVVPLLLQAIKELKCELDDVKKLIK
jgi:hypothetical protein